MTLIPFKGSIFIDSCAFDFKYEPETTCSNELFSLHEEGKIWLEITHSNLEEIKHPSTPQPVKDLAKLKIYTLNTNLTNGEKKKKQEILTILTGNGRPENMEQDANHVFETHKYGGYFVTTDERIIKKRIELNQICNAKIVKPCELLKIISEVIIG